MEILLKFWGKLLVEGRLVASFVVQFGGMTSKKVLLVATLGGRGPVDLV